MKKELTKKAKPLCCYINGKRFSPPRGKLTDKLTGEVFAVTGDVTELRGEVTSVYGYIDKRKQTT